MRQAISTKYVGHSNVRGSRIIATSGSGIKVIVDYRDDLNSEENHHQAAKQLARKLKWEGRLIGGGTKDGYCWVRADSRESNPLRRRKHRGPWPRGKTPPHLKRYLFR